MPEDRAGDYLFTAASREKLIKEKLLSKKDSFGESVVTFNKRLADYVVREYDIGDNDSDSEDSFDEDDYRFNDKKKRAYQDEDIFDYNKE